jgi:teichuronic acid exporter
LSSLKNRAVKGVIWSVAERFGNQVVQFFIGLVLARLLMPEDYGLMGMLLIFISVAQIFVEGGFSSALIRKNNPTENDYSTVFWFNLLTSLLFYLIIFVSSPYIAAFYREPSLTLLAKVVGLNIILNAFGIIQKTKLTKSLDFKSQAKINIGSLIISGTIGLTAAFYGMGVWALVIQNLFRNGLMNLGFWIQSKWTPSILFSKISFKELFGFGSKLLLSNLINIFSENLYAVIIGKFYHAKSLGFYTRAHQFQKLPVSSIYGAISVVTYPVLSELQHNGDSESLRESFRSMIKLTSFVLFPIMVILGSISEPMISVILTNKWLPSAPILQLICISGSFYPIHAINLDILKVKGRSDLFLILEIVKQVLNILVVYNCYKFGIIGLLTGALVLNIFCLYLNSFFNKILIDYSFFNMLSDLSVIFFISIVTLVIVRSLFLFTNNQYVQLITFPLFGLAFYLLIAYFLKLKEFHSIKTIFENLYKKKRVIAE